MVSWAAPSPPIRTTRRSAAAVRQAQQRVVPTHTRPREGPSYGDLVRTADQRAYSEDAKRLRNM